MNIAVFLGTIVHLTVILMRIWAVIFFSTNKYDLDYNFQSVNTTWSNK